MRFHQIRRLALAASAVVSVVIAAVTGLGRSSAAGGHRSVHAASSVTAELRAAHPPSGFSAGMLRALAYDAAKNNGDAVPSSVEAVKTTHKEAWHLMFPGMPARLLPTDKQPVDFIVMTGHFTDRGVGPGNITVSGTQLHLVVDMHGDVLDGGLNHLPAPNLARVGPVMHLNQ
jgi:hypothetical protein